MNTMTSTRNVWRTLVTCIALSASFSGIAVAQTVRLELHPFPTMTLTDREFLTGAKDGKPTVIVGELRIPRAGGERLPTVVLVHGSGGAGARETGWAEHLSKLGIATFTLDSFTGRGITSTGENQALLPRLAMVSTRTVRWICWQSTRGLIHRASRSWDSRVADRQHSIQA